MAEKQVLIERKGKVAYVLLHRPEKLNALSFDLLTELNGALDELAKDDSVSVLIVTGTDRAFSVGYDVGKYKDGTIGVLQDRDNLEWYTRLWLKIWEYPKPVIAQVRGYALAGGTQLLASCDFVICDKDAILGFPSLPLGGGFVGLYWHFHIGPQRAKMLDLTAGSRITGEQAVEYGFAARCFPGDVLEEETLKIAQGIARTPLDILKLKKAAHNRVMEMQGFRNSVMFGPEQDALIHCADGVKLMREKINTLGLSEAIRWFNEQEV